MSDQASAYGSLDEPAARLRTRPRARIVLQNLAIIAPLFFVNAAGTPGNALFFVILCAMAAHSSEWTVKAISLMYLAIVGNVALVSTGGPVFGAGKFLFLMICSLRLLYSMRLIGLSAMSHRIMLPLILFVLVAFLLAIEGGYYVYVSGLKLFAFLIGIVTVFAAIEVMRHRRHELDRWFLALAVFILIIGVLADLAGVGYNSQTLRGFGARFFNGPFYHSQTLGPGAALIVLYLMSYGLLTAHPDRRIALLMIPPFLLFVYISGSRTSLLAIIMAMALALAMLVFMRSAALTKMTKVIRFAFLISMAAILLGVMAELARPGILLDQIVDFMIKNESGGAINSQTLLYSRQVLIEMMWQNIVEQPWTGIGFGTSTDPAFVYRAGLLSAPTEKGIMPLALLEETGIIGTAFFTLLIVAILAYSVESNNVPGLMGFAGIIGVNLAEANFFSFGGQGGFFWIWVMACFILNDATRTRTT